jgi:predicted branched-subunit amino acid permease
MRAIVIGLGATFAVAFVVIVSPEWVSRPTLLPALAFGVVTVALPMLVLQPALGLGVASAKAARPWAARVKSVATHIVYGVGLYAIGLVVTRW